MLIRICREIFGSSLVGGLFIGGATHTGKFPLDAGVALSTYFIALAAVLFVVLIKKVPDFARPPQKESEPYDKFKYWVTVGIGVSLVIIQVHNILYWLHRVH